MKHIHWRPAEPPYSLHDMNVIALEVQGDDLLLRTQSGMTATTPPHGQPDGHLVFHHIDWDFCYACLTDFCGNTGPFSGKKVFLRDFLAEFFTAPHNTGFSVLDETYGFNQAKYTGLLFREGTLGECTIEIYHTGGMTFAVRE